MAFASRWVLALGIAALAGEALRQEPTPHRPLASTETPDSISGLVDFARQHAEPLLPPSGQPLVVLSFADSRYRAIIVNWMAGMHKLGLTNYAVVCMDQGLADFMASIARPCFHASPAGGKLTDIWRLRLRALGRLVDEGVSVLLSDADAVWLRRPFSFLRVGDIVAQQGNHPRNVFKKLGGTAVMGWAFFRGSPAVGHFMKQVYDVFDDSGRDDQIALNKALLANGLSFSKRPDCASSESFSGRAGNLTVVLLDCQHFVRSRATNETHAGNEAYMMHCCYTGLRSDALLTEKLMKGHGTWFLRDQYSAEIGGHGNFDSWIGEALAA